MAFKGGHGADVHVECAVFAQGGQGHDGGEVHGDVAGGEVGVQLVVGAQRDVAFVVEALPHGDGLDDAFVGEIDVFLIRAEQFAARREDQRLVAPVVGQLDAGAGMGGLFLDDLADFFKLLPRLRDVRFGQAGFGEDVHVDVHHHGAARDWQADLHAVPLAQRQRGVEELAGHGVIGFLAGGEILHRNRVHFGGDVVEQVVAAHEDIRQGVARRGVGDHALQQLEVFAGLGGDFDFHLGMFGLEGVEHFVEERFVGTAPAVPDGDGGGFVGHGEAGAGREHHNGEKHCEEFLHDVFSFSN